MILAWVTIGVKVFLNLGSPWNESMEYYI